MLLTHAKKFMEKKKYHVTERDFASAYGKSGKRYKNKDDAQKLLDKEGYTKIGESNRYKNKSNEIAWLTPLRDANLKQTILCTWNEKKKVQEEEVQFEVVSYFPVGWLVTFQKPYKPISCTDLKFQKPMKFKRIND